MLDESDRSLRLVSYHDDQPVEEPGVLIPRPKNELVKAPDFHPLGAVKTFSVAPYLGLGFGAVALFMLAILGTASYGLVAENTQVATPIVTIIDPYTNERSALGFGQQDALSINNFFIQTRDAFIDESTTFIEIDVSAEQLRYFKRGVLLQTAEIEAIGEPGSWWSVPSGLYEVESLEERPFSNLAQMYLPFTVRFGGNYLIHGGPVFPDGTELLLDESVAGIRIDTEAAEQLYQTVAEGVTVLVHTPPQEPDTFVYEPVAPDIEAPHYLIADVENGTILAASELDVQASVASIVKLMTAVIAAEEIDLDTRVRATAPSFIESLIPRLADRQSVSMYSLLQLLLVESSNEAAEVIAGQIGREAFIELMNEKARQIGMYDTVFVDPSGVLAGNVSTVGDLYTLGRYINDNRSFIFEITDTSRVATDYGEGAFGDLVNFNNLQDVDSFIGGKVGESTSAGQTSVSLHEIVIQGETRVVMIILLGSEERSADMQALLDHVTANFSTN